MYLSEEIFSCGFMYIVDYCSFKLFFINSLEYLTKKKKKKKKRQLYKVKKVTTENFFVWANKSTYFYHSKEKSLPPRRSVGGVEPFPHEKGKLNSQTSRHIFFTNRNIATDIFFFQCHKKKKLWLSPYLQG